MHPQTLLDFVVFQLTPTRTRCDLYVAAGEETEKLASGILKPFCLHLKAVKEQLAKGGHSIRLQPPVHTTQQCTWFTKGILQRFIRFVSNPDVLERIGTIEVELKQLDETLRMQTRNFSKTHAQHLRMNLSGSLSPRGARRTMLGNTQKLYQKKQDSHGLDGNITLGHSRKRLLHALEARRTILQKEQGMSFARATAAGFDDAHVKELILFSDCFGATRLREACLQFMSLYKSRQETSICAESMSTTTCIQSNRSPRTQGGRRILCKLHVLDNSGSSRMLEEGHEGSQDTEWPCTNDKENENFTCHAGKEQPSNHSAADEDSVPQNSCSCDEYAKVYTLKQNSPVAEGKYLSAGEKYKENKRSSVVISDSSCTSHRCNCHGCCHNPLRGPQADHKVSSSVNTAPCKDVTTCQCMPESEFPSSNLSSQVTNGEVLHELVSNPSSYDPACMKLHERFTIQVNNSFDHECLLSHCFNHNATRKKQAVHECCSSNEECVDQAQSRYDQENVSNLIVINNQIFSASHYVDSYAKKDEEIEVARKCCKEQTRGDRSKPFHLCVRDMVSVLERRSQDHLLPQDVCQKQESTNFQNVRNNIVERWSADSSLIGEDCQKINGEPETIRIDGRETLLSGENCCLSKMVPNEVQGRERAGSECSDDLKPSKFNDKEAGSWNPLYQELAPNNTSSWMECTKENLSGNSSAKETTRELSSQGDFATECHIHEPQTSGRQATVPQQLISSVSRPSEERVKRFLERYYEKREEKLRNRVSAEKERESLATKSAQPFLEKECPKRASSYASEKSIKSSKRDSEAGKPQTYKVNKPKSKKSKDDKDQRCQYGLHACQQDQLSTSTTASDCITTKSPRSVQLQKSNSRLSSAKLPTPRKASNASGLVPSKQKEAAGLLPGSRNRGASKRDGNPQRSSAVSKIDNKRVGTSSMRASTSSLAALNNRRISQARNSLQSKSMTTTGSADRKPGALRTNKVTPHAVTASVKDQGKSSGMNAKAKGTSLLGITNEGAKEGPKSFLRKGTGSSRLTVRSSVLQPKSVNNKETNTMYKGISSISSPSLVSQTSTLPQEQQLLSDTLECLLVEQAGGKEGTPSTAISAAQICSTSIVNYTDGYETEAKRESVKGVKRKGYSATLLPEEPSPLPVSSNMQLNHCVEVHGSNKSGYAGAACLDDKLQLTTFSLAEPFIDSLQSNAISIRCDPFEIPAAQDRVFTEAQFLAQSCSTHQFDSGLLDVTRSTPNFQQSRTKGDASRITSFLEHHASTNNQGKDIKRFLKFGWRNNHATTGSDQASASAYSEEEEDSGSFSEPMPKILDCYGRKRHASGKPLNPRVSGSDCSPSTPEHYESKGRKSIIRLKRSISTHEVHSKSRDRNVSKTSAVKETRAFFSLAPFRRKSVEGK